MHGRLKVRTTEEEKERKNKEQTLKVKAYKCAMAKIQYKRQLQELDDELLQLTSQILLRNPDVSTLWNIRRECVVQKGLQYQSDVEKQQAIYDMELNFSEQCLLVNPKSYNCWHHRAWTLEHSPNANWEREVQLCSKYLKMDERNFHTWDYRRYVAEKANVSKQSELDFCTDKIKANFSNYSSWHHRSLLLPLMYPYKRDALPRLAMSEEKLREELEMVLTAAFTDPNDSSAWFYQRWLLGYSRQELDVCSFRCDNNKAMLAFTNPFVLNEAAVSIWDSNGKVLVKFTNWYSIDGNEADTIWMSSLSNDAVFNISDISESLHLEINIPGIDTKQLPLQTFNNSLYNFTPPKRNFVFTHSVLTELVSQLESCESLLEYEPDSKWTLLTSALLMRALGRPQDHKKSLIHLDKLQKVDILRENYYRDMTSKWILEKRLADWAETDDIPKMLDLRGETQLNALFYPQYLCIADSVLLPTNLSSAYGSKLRLWNCGT